MIVAAEAAGYIMTLGTDGGGNDQETNSCGIAKSHAYSLLAGFTMTDASNVAHEVLLARNPWGVTEYTGTWKHDDSNWTDALVAQVPLGIDPRTSNTKGIFVVPKNAAIKRTNPDTTCFG